MSTASTADNRPYLKFYTQGRIFQLPTTAQKPKFLDRVGMSTASTAKKFLSAPAEFLQTVRIKNRNRLTNGSTMGRQFYIYK